MVLTQLQARPLAQFVRLDGLALLLSQAIECNVKHQPVNTHQDSHSVAKHAQSAFHVPKDSYQYNALLDPFLVCGLLLAHLVLQVKHASQ